MRSLRMLQGRWTYYILFVVFIAFTVFIFYNHIQSDIARLDDARRQLAFTVAQLQLHNIGKGQNKVISNSELNWQEDNIQNSVDDILILYNRVPKTGSTSFMGVAYDLCGVNKFHVLHINTTKNSHVLSLSDQARFVYNITSWKRKKPAIYHGHMAFLDFQRFGIREKPIYINLIRKPLDRFVSYFSDLMSFEDDKEIKWGSYKYIFGASCPSSLRPCWNAMEISLELGHQNKIWLSNSCRHMRYVGQPEVGDKSRATLVRSCIDVGTSNNVVPFLNELGFRADYEFVLKGYMFRKGRMKVTVAKVCRLLQQGNPDSIEPVSQSYLVELSVVALSGQDSLADEMKAFAEQLKPLVQLEKIDHRRLHV